MRFETGLANRVLELVLAIRLRFIPLVRDKEEGRSTVFTLFRAELGPRSNVANLWEEALPREGVSTAWDGALERAEAAALLEWLPEKRACAAALACEERSSRLSFGCAIKFEPVKAIERMATDRLVILVDDFFMVVKGVAGLDRRTAR
jgi:hypothetical protein